MTLVMVQGQLVKAPFISYCDHRHIYNFSLISYSQLCLAFMLRPHRIARRTRLGHARCTGRACRVPQVEFSPTAAPATGHKRPIGSLGRAMRCRTCTALPVAHAPRPEVQVQARSPVRRSTDAARWMGRKTDDANTPSGAGTAGGNRPIRLGRTNALASESTRRLEEQLITSHHMCSASRSAVRGSGNLG